MALFISTSPAATEELGFQWAADVFPGFVLGLKGDLGAGKTALSRGLVRGLGLESRVHSPTFALVNEYRNDKTQVFHLDLYRLNHGSEIFSAGLDQILLKKHPIIIVEWINRLGEPQEILANFPSLKLRHVTVTLLSETERSIAYEDFGF